MDAPSPGVPRDLADAALAIVAERMATARLSVSAVARTMGVRQSTLSRQLHGRGDLTLDEWDALAAAAGTGLIELLALARARCAIGVGA